MNIIPLTILPDDNCDVCFHFQLIVSTMVFHTNRDRPGTKVVRRDVDVMMLLTIITHVLTGT